MTFEHASPEITAHCPICTPSYVPKDDRERRAAIEQTRLQVEALQAERLAEVTRNARAQAQALGFEIKSAQARTLRGYL